MKWKKEKPNVNKHTLHTEQQANRNMMRVSAKASDCSTSCFGLSSCVASSANPTAVHHLSDTIRPAERLCRPHLLTPSCSPSAWCWNKKEKLLSCGSYLAALVTAECQSQPTQESSLKIASGNNALSTDNVWCSDWSWHEICQVMYASLVLFHCLWKVFIGFLATLFYLVFMYCLFISHLH